MHLFLCLSSLIHNFLMKKLKYLHNIAIKCIFSYNLFLLKHNKQKFYLYLFIFNIGSPRQQIMFNRQTNLFTLKDLLNITSWQINVYCSGYIHCPSHVITENFTWHYLCVLNQFYCINLYCWILSYRLKQKISKCDASFISYFMYAYTVEICQKLHVSLKFLIDH